MSVLVRNGVLLRIAAMQGLKCTLQRPQTRVPPSTRPAWINSAQRAPHDFSISAWARKVDWVTAVSRLTSACVFTKLSSSTAMRSPLNFFFSSDTSAEHRKSLCHCVKEAFKTSRDSWSFARCGPVFAHAQAGSASIAALGVCVCVVLVCLCVSSSGRGFPWGPSCSLAAWGGRRLSGPFRRSRSQ